MLKLLLWMVGAYLVLKVCHLLFWPKPGFGRQETELADALRKGEPAILIAAVLIPTVSMLGFNAWLNQWVSRDVERSVTCFAHLEARERLPNFFQKFKRSDVYRAEVIYYDEAKLKGALIHLSDHDANTKLYAAKATLVRDFNALAKSGDRRAIAEKFAVIDDCLRDDSPVNE